MKLYPDPGVLPKFLAPKAGQQIFIEVKGSPPYKDKHFSIRNPRSPQFEKFMALRNAAINAMDGRKWYDGPVMMEFIYYAEKLDRPLVDYAGGINDTLDGSHGPSFTYLPIVYQDDCQIAVLESKFVKSNAERYSIRIEFLD